MSVNSPEPKDVDDLSSLDNLDNNVILHYLQKRFENGQIYTYIGDVLVAINPCCNTPIYGNEFHQRYTDLRVRLSQPPHIYWLADFTYRNLLESRLKQCVVVTGDSGAGKTESTKYILKHLITRAKCAIPDLVDRLKKVNPLIELFGNAATVFNQNSSRFGKFIELQYGNDGELLGGRIQTFVLEKSRVVYHGFGEKNFHVFHSLIAGADEQKLLYYYIENPTKYRILHENGSRPDTSHGIYNDPEDMLQCARLFREAENIMYSIGFSDEDIHNLYQMLSAILHISNIEFQEDEETNGLIIVDESHLYAASAMLKLTDHEGLITAMITNTKYIKGEELKSLKSIRQANDGRDSVCKELYRCLFAGIIDKVNEILKPENTQQARNGQALSIGILDISGFENLQHNSFEQLLINITNERLHQYFQKQIFDVEYRDYKLEGIDAEEINFFDNSDVLNLLFKKIGILSILEEEMAVPGSNDTSLVSKYNKHLKDSPCYRQKSNRNEFAIVHYAGEVLYEADGFLDKNRGTLSNTLKKCITGSENIFVKKYFESNGLQTRFKPVKRGDSLSKAKAREIFQSMRKKGEAIKAEQTRAKLYDSEAHKYKRSLSELNDKLLQAKPNFIRCIKPNLELAGGKFDSDAVRKQLEASGVLEVTKIRKDGYPVRIKFDVFVSKYNKLLRDVGTNVDSCKNAQSILHISGVNNYKLGKTKVFLKTNDVDKIERHVDDMNKEEELKRQNPLKQTMSLSTEAESNRTSVSSQFCTKKDPTTFINIPESPVSVDYSLPNTPKGDVSPTATDDKLEKDSTQLPAWDIFRITERDVEGCGEFEAMILRGCRLITCFIISLLVFSAGVGSVGSLLFLSANLNQEIFRKETSTEIVMCLSCPIALTWISSLFRVLFGRTEIIKKRFLFPALILDGLHVAGTAILVYKVLPNFDIFTNLTIVFALGQAPAVLNFIRQILRKRKFIIRILSIFFAFLAVVAQFIMHPLLYGVGITNLWTKDNKHLVNTPLDFTNQWYLAVAIFLISLGWVENFINNDIFCIPFIKWRKALDKSRDKVMLISGPIKLAIFIGLTFALVPGTNLSLSIKNDSMTKGTSSGNDTFQNGSFLLSSTEFLYDTSTIYTVNASTIHIINGSGGQNKTSLTYAIDSARKIFDNFGLMLLQIGCSLVCSYCAGLACKLHMQRLGFYLPLILVIPACFGLSFYLCKQCIQSDNGMESQKFFEGHLLCPSMDIDLLFTRFVIGGVIGISIIAITWHEVFPKAERMAKIERLFVLPIQEGLFTIMGLLFRRRDDIYEDEMRKKQNERRKKKENEERPFVHVCVTMWHENRLEMLQLLKSLFRIDAYKSQGQIAEKKFKVRVDYFDVDIHVIFDDAFETDRETKQRIPNNFVQQFLECLNEAVVSVAKGHIDWDSTPTKVTTPYGGRLTWTMPGRTELCVHMKDKCKIRHRKRWSQIMYMYYLLGYHNFESKKEVEILSNHTKRHLVRPFTSILNRVKTEHVEKGNNSNQTGDDKLSLSSMMGCMVLAFNTFILTLDGDVDFRPDAVQLLIDRMRKNRKVAAVCGRIHPIGSGPMVWYQKFEYAVGHWLQKAAEHIFGCVLCCPGCFSLFRVASLMDDNVVRMYTKPPTEATHYIQFEQGEDRWLSTLLLQQGWKIDYCAGADALTYAPETFKEFYVQRRRWTPSTMANIMDLLSSWATTTEMNDNISTPFVAYQFLIMTTSLLAPGTVIIMISGSFASVLGLSLGNAYLLSIFPVLGYIIVCLKIKHDTQILVAAIMSSLYSVVMVIVTLGTIMDISTSLFLSPNVMFLTALTTIFVVSGLLHPKEIGCLLHGILYFFTVPSSFVFLAVYVFCNLHVVTWGTREGQSKDINVETKPKEKQKTKKKGTRFLNALGINNCIKEIITSVRELIDSVTKEKVNKKTTHASEAEHQQIHLPKPLVTQKRDLPVTLNPEAWKNVSFLQKSTNKEADEAEIAFWNAILKKYLHPITEQKDHQKKIKNDLLTLRNNVVFGYFLLNFLFSIAILQLQIKEDQLKSFYIGGEYEPFSLAFLCVFAFVLLIQFLGMIAHRWGTYLHLISTVQIEICTKKRNDAYYAKLAFQEAGKLQSEEPEPDYLATDVDRDSEALNSTANNSRNNTLTHDEVPLEPDYSDEEMDEIGSVNQDKPPPSAYERNFVKRYRSIRHRYRQSNHQRNPTSTPIFGYSVHRNELYNRTFDRHFGRRHQHV